VTYVLIALPIVLFLVWMARGWFVARKNLTSRLPTQFPDNLP
jgi:uncharacterized protein YneF (UPF0154 family)